MTREEANEVVRRFGEREAAAAPTTLEDFAEANGVSLDRAGALLERARTRKPPPAARPVRRGWVALFALALLGLGWLDPIGLVADAAAARARFRADGTARFGPDRGGSRYDPSFRPSSVPPPGVGATVDAFGVMWGAGDRLAGDNPDRLDERTAAPLREMLDHAREEALRGRRGGPSVVYDSLVPEAQTLAVASVGVQTQNASGNRPVAIPRDDDLWIRERDRAIRLLFEDMGWHFDNLRGVR